MSFFNSLKVCVLFRALVFSACRRQAIAEHIRSFIDQHCRVDELNSYGRQLFHSQPPPNRSRPNYFFAVQITNPEIKARFTAVQEEVGKASPKVKPAFVPVELAHLTLGVMHLLDNDAVNRVISVMEDFRAIHQKQGPQETHQREEQELEQDQSAEERTASLDLPHSPPGCDSAEPAPSVCVKSDTADLSDVSASDSAKTVTVDPSLNVTSDAVTADRTEKSGMVDPVKNEVADKACRGHEETEKSDGIDGEKGLPKTLLEVKGLDNFRDTVVFAKVTEGQALDWVKSAAERLRAQVLAQDISMDSKPFAPHITLMKMSKNPKNLKAAGVKKIDSKLYQEFSDTHFGTNAVTSIQLCAMLKPKKNNYYHVEHEISLH